jgi:sugar-specific transcriptional regulator TrmB
MNENLIEDIKGLGLNSYEAKVYLALMERDSLSVSEVSKISKVPRARTYDILDTLVTQGLATLKPGRFKKYSASDPDSLREKLIIRSENHYADEKRTIERVTLSLKRKFESALDSDARRSNPLDYIEVIREPYQIHKKIVKLTSETKDEILFFTKPPYSGEKAGIEEQTQQQSRLLEKGIRIRSIYEVPASAEQRRWLLGLIETAVKNGEEARVLEHLPMKMAIFDEKTLVFALEDPILGESSLTTLVIKHRALAWGQKMLFDSLWSIAKDYNMLKNQGGDGG